MQEFDTLIFANWPRGLYLAKQLALIGQKVAYVELLPRLKNPFALLISENEQKEFLESLGFLSLQKGGFCLLSSEGVWPLQEMKKMKERLAAIHNFTSSLDEESLFSFKDNWLSYLSLNLSAKVFDSNNSIFRNKGIDLFADYFLFEPSAKKIENFKKNHSNIFFEATLKKDITFKGQPVQLSLKDTILTAKKTVCLTPLDRILDISESSYKACWQWQAYYLEVNFRNYKETVPSHFIFLKNLFFPWCYDNLLSIFHREGILEVWMRLKPKEDPLHFINQSEKNLKDFFKGCHLKYINKPIAKSFKIYGPDRLNFNFSKQNIYIENCKDFFHGDLISEIQSEQELFKKLTNTV